MVGAEWGLIVVRVHLHRLSYPRYAPVTFIVIDIPHDRASTAHDVTMIATVRRVFVKDALRWLGTHSNRVSALGCHMVMACVLGQPRAVAGRVAVLCQRAGRDLVRAW